ncbi:hypothetical protein BJ741DRAFT_634229 [Chytriomyces cf. hyalinus JEL632]|nr:hypothetical protein BJ741DRAFT_634229 [Chytriomyces cf. hyalinus JEL632]
MHLPLEVLVLVLSWVDSSRDAVHFLLAYDSLLYAVLTTRTLQARMKRLVLCESDSTDAVHSTESTLGTAPVRSSESYASVLQLRAFTRRLLRMHPTQVRSNVVSFSLDWTLFLIAKHFGAICENCLIARFNHSDFAIVSLSYSEESIPSINVNSHSLSRHQAKVLMACLPSASKPSCCQTTVPAPIAPLKPAKEDEIESTSKVINDWYARVLSRRKQRAMLRASCFETSKKWMGGTHIEGWTPAVPKYSAPADSDSDENADENDQPIKEDDEIQTDRHAKVPSSATTAALSAKCPGCQFRYCNPCIQAVNPCPSCSAQLCMGCFPPDITSDSLAFLARLDPATPVFSDSSTSSTPLGNPAAFEKRQAGRSLECSSCSKKFCVGCANLEPWQIKQMETRADPAANTRLQAFSCEQCRDWHAYANTGTHHEFEEEWN